MGERGGPSAPGKAVGPLGSKKGIRFVIATGNEIHRMRQLLGPFGQTGDPGRRQRSSDFEDDQMVLGKFWDRELVEAVLLILRPGNFRSIGCVSCQWWLYQGRHGLYRS